MRSKLRTLSALTLLVLFVTMSAPMVRAQATDTILKYYDENAVRITFPLPGQYGVTSGQDTARRIVAYGERFSAPWPVTYVDSAWIVMRIDKLQGDALISIELRKAIA